MKKYKRGLNPHQIRKISQKIFEKKHTANQSSVDISHLILTNSDIYVEIAEYVIKFRMVTWRNNHHTPTQIRNKFLENHLIRICYIGRKLSLKNNEISELKRLTQELTDQLVTDKKLNTHWATDYLVSLYREGMKWNLRKQLSFYTHINPSRQTVILSGMISFNIKMDDKKKYKLIKFWNLKENIPNIIYETYIEREKTFFTYMPEDCIDKDTYHALIQFLIIWTFINSLLFFLKR